MVRKKKQIVVPEDTEHIGSLVTAMRYGLTKAEVTKKANAYFAEFHPMGYSTTFRQPIQKHADGYWFCVISRGTHCD